MSVGERPTDGGTGTPREGRRSAWTAGRVVGMVLCSIGALVGLALLVGGGAVLAAQLFERDDDGYFTTDRERLESATPAITTEEIDLGDDAVDWAPDEVLGDVRIRVTGTDPVFVGIAADSDVAEYLSGVAHDELVDFDDGEARFDLHEGGAPPQRPQSQDIWVAQAEGSGEQTLSWDADFGRWTVVVMNADGSRGVDVEADAGVKVDWVVWAGIGLVVLGLILLGIAAALIVLIGRRAERDKVTASP